MLLGVPRKKNVLVRVLTATPVLDSRPISTLRYPSSTPPIPSMDHFQQPHHKHDSFDIPPITNPPPQYFGSNENSDSPTLPNFEFADGDGPDQDGGHDESNDAKRRRIARVCTRPLTILCLMALTIAAGV